MTMDEEQIRQDERRRISEGLWAHGLKLLGQIASFDGAASKSAIEVTGCGMMMAAGFVEGVQRDGLGVPPPSTGPACVPPDAARKLAAQWLEGAAACDDVAVAVAYRNCAHDVLRAAHLPPGEMLRVRRELPDRVVALRMLAAQWRDAPKWHASDCARDLDRVLDDWDADLVPGLHEDVTP